jgi:hypothetical protein
MIEWLFIILQCYCTIRNARNPEKSRGLGE